MYAIIDAGGRQAKVEPGALLKVDRFDAEPGEQVTLDRILLIETDGGDVTTGAPYVKGATITAVVLAQIKEKKIRVFKMKRRKHYRRTKGHRSQKTQIKITSINT
jgi:large subunit ribosomal protein L21